MNLYINYTALVLSSFYTTLSQQNKSGLCCGKIDQKDNLIFLVSGSLISSSGGQTQVDT